jgi:N-acyl-D-aspartate/D-glutamate deacylase
MLARACRDFDAVFQATPNPREPLSFLRLAGLGIALDRRPLRLMMLTALDLDHVPGLWRIFPVTTALLNRVLGGNMRFQTLPEPFSVQAEGPITPLFEEFPAGVQLNDQTSAEGRRNLWRDPTFRKTFAKQWAGGWGRTFHRDLRRMEVMEAPEPSMIGRSLADLAAGAGKVPIEHFMDLLERFDTDLVWTTTGANSRPGPRRHLLAHPHILPGFSDAGAHVRHMGYYDGALTLLREAYQSGCMAMERAVARVTGEAAAWYRLDRGILKLGAVADVVLLNPVGLSEPIAPHLRVRDPLLDNSVRCVKRGSEGLLKAVWVRGQLAWREGVTAPELAQQAMGELLRLPEPVMDSRDAVDGKLTPHRLGHYWDVFLLKHQHPANVALHLAGALLFYAVLVLAWAKHNPWLLVFLPLSQLTGLLGHWIFERSPIDRQDAIFSFRATLSLNRMMLALLSGRYFREVARARALWGAR